MHYCLPQYFGCQLIHYFSPSQGAREGSSRHGGVRCKSGTVDATFTAFVALFISYARCIWVVPSDQSKPSDSIMENPKKYNRFASMIFLLGICHEPSTHCKVDSRVGAAFNFLAQKCEEAYAMNETRQVFPVIGHRIQPIRTGWWDDARSASTSTVHWDLGAFGRWG